MKLFKNIKDFFEGASKEVYLSLYLMGLGQIKYKQYTKGIIYMLIEVLFIIYMFLQGFGSISGFISLGTKAADPWTGATGDNSVLFLLKGIFTFAIITSFIFLYVSNIKSAKENQIRLEKKLYIKSFKEEAKSYLYENFYKLAIIIPIVLVSIFSILPIIFMIFIAFTNYGGDIIPPTSLIDWVGFSNFLKLISISELSKTFFDIFVWNIIWALLSTAINYFLGLGIALLINRKIVKGKAFIRVFPVLAFAIPGFITLLSFKFMFSYGGPINYYVQLLGNSAIGFLDIDAGWTARIVGLFVNSWLSVPSIMLLTTGLLGNMNQEVYEAAEIDGANKLTQFIKLTLPFIFFATTPTLITQVIGNFNNFGIFYFLRSGIIVDGYFLANDTDLLINWLYRLSVDNTYYSIGAAISLAIFLITATISLVFYTRSAAYKQEDIYK